MGHFNKKKLQQNNGKKNSQTKAKNQAKKKADNTPTKNLNLKTKTVQNGRIGKPSKSHKHKTIRATSHYDPDTVMKTKQKMKSNSKPSNDNDQEMSKRLKELIKRKDDFKLAQSMTQKKKKKPKNDPIEVKGMTKPEVEIPKFKKRINESDRAFVFRVDKETHNVVAKTQMADKYKTTVEEMEDGKVAVKKKKKGNVKTKERLQKLHDRKKKTGEVYKDFSNTQGYDEVKFGDVVMAPPSLNAKPRNAETIVPKHTQSKTKGLLLAKMFAGGVSESGTPGAVVREPGQTVKHKDMTPLQIAQHEKTRENVIQMYRFMKAKKLAAKQS